MRKRLVLLAAATVWLAAICLATGSLMEVERRPGRDSGAPDRWPRESMLQPSPGAPTVLVFAHPKCPCTRATLDQVALLVSRSPRPLKGRVLFSRPSELPSAWARTLQWERAAAIPGFSVQEDVDAREARRFGATTSGHVMLYDAGGILRFSGGLTAGRGLEGPSAGLQSIRNGLDSGTCAFARTPVFGCPLGDSERSE